MDTSQYYAQLAPIYDPTRAWVEKQRAGLEPQFQEQLSGLEQAKLNAYRDIETTARGRGMQFSGFSPEQQARYLGATYMPAVANLRANMNTRMSELDKAIIEANAQQQTQALGLYQTEKTRQQEMEKWQKEMDWKTQQAELDRQAARASRGGGSSGPTEQDLYAAIGSTFGDMLAAKIGKDGHVSPSTYVNIKNQAAKAGVTSDQFDSVFAAYVNPAHAWEYSTKYSKKD